MDIVMMTVKVDLTLNEWDMLIQMMERLEPNQNIRCRLHHELPDKWLNEAHRQIDELRDIVGSAHSRDRAKSAFNRGMEWEEPVRAALRSVGKKARPMFGPSILSEYEQAEQLARHEALIERLSKLVYEQRQEIEELAGQQASLRRQLEKERSGQHGKAEGSGDAGNQGICR